MYLMLLWGCFKREYWTRESEISLCRHILDFENVDSKLLIVLIQKINST